MTQDIGTHVLVVDDEAGFRELLTRILESAGCEVRTAHNAHAALQSIGEAGPAVALCDVHMPGPDGIWLAAQIRAISPATAVVLATSDDTIPPADSFRRGIVAYLVKPFERRAVLSAVADAFRWAEAQSGHAMPTLVVPPEQPPAADKPARSLSEPAVRASRPGAVRRRAIAAAAAALVLVGAIYAFSDHTRSGNALQLIEAASGVVVATDADGRTMGQGSGFFAGPDLFVTSRHVVSGAVGATIRQPGTDGMFTVAGVAASDSGHDLVLLKTSRDASAHLTVAVPSRSPELGDDISVYGAPLGLQGTLSTGIISAKPDGPDQMLQISAPISPGSSGSPVVNEDGELIGVATASRMEGQNLNFAVPAVHAVALMSSAGPVRPLISLGRGSGTDAERHELLGPVRLSTTMIETVRPASTETRAVVFDRQGRTLEETVPDGTTTQYTYDANGSILEASERSGDGAIKRWQFSRVGPLIREAYGQRPWAGWSRRIEYLEDGRLAADELRNAQQQVVAGVRWTYSQATWPVKVGPVVAATTALPTSHETYDPIGNVTKRIHSDGTEWTFEYRFDRRANWTSREAFRTVNGSRVLISREERDIQYW